MRKWMSLIAASALVLSASVPAQAAPYAAAGVLTIVVGTLPPISIPLATVVDVTGGTLSIPAGAASTSGYFVPVVGFPLGLITGLVVTASNGAGSFSIPAWPTAGNIAGGGFGGSMAINGVDAGEGRPGAQLPISVIGVGGGISVGGITVEGAQWTTGVAYVTTNGPVGATYSLTGTNNMGLVGGQLTLVTPAHVNAAGLTRLPVFSMLTLQIVPEPGTMLLLGAGIAGLAAISRKRMSK